VTERSGNLRLRLPKSLHKALADRARSEGVSLNTLMLTFLATRLAQLSPPRESLIARLIASEPAPEPEPARR
jgi:hypothetical protein